MNRLAIRWRLTLWYSGILVAILAVFGAGVYVLMSRHLLSRMDRGLEEELQGVDEELEEASTTGGLRARLHRRFGHYEHVLFDVRYADGSDPLFGRRLGEDVFPPSTAPGAAGQVQFMTFHPAQGDNWRIASRGLDGPEGAMFVRAAASLKADERELRELTAALLLAGLLAVACALAGGYALARRALAPLDRMALAAHDISVSRLDRRLEAPNPHDELGRLAATFNDMIARLERSFADMQRFTADAAHELRTPVAVMRSEAEIALRAPRTADEYRKSLESLLEEAERLTHLADELLFLCREDAGMARHDFSDVQLDQLAADVAEHMRVLAQDRGIELRATNLPACQVHGDGDRLRRLLFNLLDNALKYTPARGTVSLELHRRHGQVELTVADSGAGIPAEDLPHVFQRFYRVNAARSSGGSGLGLAICRAIVESHGGTIGVRSEVGQGTTIIVGLRMSSSQSF